MNKVDLSGLRVLVVEDEGLVSMLIEEYLDVLGCITVGTASRLDDALDKAARLDIDVALLDVNLAGQLSYPVAELLKSRDVRVVFATGYGVDALPDGLRDTPVLAKPFREHQLAAVLGAVRTAQAGVPAANRQPSAA